MLVRCGIWIEIGYVVIVVLNCDASYVMIYAANWFDVEY